MLIRVRHRSGPEWNYSSHVHGTRQRYAAARGSGQQRLWVRSAVLFFAAQQVVRGALARGKAKSESSRCGFSYVFGMDERPQTTSCLEQELAETSQWSFFRLRVAHEKKKSLSCATGCRRFRASRAWPAFSLTRASGSFIRDTAELGRVEDDFSRALHMKTFST